MSSPIAIKEELKIKLTENECPYSFKFSVIENSLAVDILEDDSVPSINYNSKFTLDQLIDKNRYFKILNSVEEFMPELKILCDENKIRLERQQQSIIVIISLPSKIVGELKLLIPLVEMDKKKVFAELCTTINELKREIKSLKAVQITDEKLENNLKSKDILLNEEEKKMVCDWILKVMKSKGKIVNMTLLYKVTTHGDSASTFHSRCNNKGYTLTLVRNTKGYSCGGFTTASWSSCSNYKNDANALL